MITNGSLTIYHKIIDENTRLEKWLRYNYQKVWLFYGKSASVNKGYDNNNNIEIRIPYEFNEVDINNISIGDIIVKGDIATDITQQSDLKDFEVFNIVNIRDNNFGNNPHIHIGGN